LTIWLCKFRVTNDATKVALGVGWNVAHLFTVHYKLQGIIEV